ncbi:SubName: Full=Uncharacterized protein {ECO:0000313/EMBL:CCA74383.1} [Serendipita indica DSM 11827]|nr:SubName: Full=Uncharacterized protein {ECO:0000313/EMBL:CCA74383.1} [Serendipita indica DSM 11827]
MRWKGQEKSGEIFPLHSEAAFPSMKSLPKPEHSAITSGTADGEEEDAKLIQGSTLFDPAVENKMTEVLEQLKKKYPMDTCKKHPDIRRVHQESSAKHFSVDHIALKSWAVAILKKETDIDHIPQNNILKDSVIKMTRKSTSSVTEITNSAGPLATIDPSMMLGRLNPTVLGQMIGASLMPVFTMHRGFPPQHIDTTHLLSLPKTPPSPPNASQNDRETSPIRFCDTKNISLETWGQKYGIAADSMTLLKEIGFVPGQSLDDFRERYPEEYKNTGFKPLKWDRVTKAARVWKKALAVMAGED